MKILSYRHVTSVDSVKENRCERKVLQVIVDDAEEFALMAKSNGLELEGPFVQEDKRVYTLTAHDRMPVTIHSEK
ncbi:hypothetical protein LCM20_13875 [Halobacillus litoralis]|uniref:hypothetical protein n=1 Tax=Halobacillus litoralis TaxID=45668 RepID=UPI001CD734EC|nr:hypothetical protein [Halobacillus litoralis]MCA0971690.1 hypothetical protein [Halobacillus litoralis]